MTKSTLPADGAYYTMTVSKNGKTVCLTFANDDARFEARRELRKSGYVIDEYPLHGYVLYKSAASAIHTADIACG